DGRSLPQAQVRLMVSGAPLQSRVAHADGSGRYEFADLPAGSFTLMASKAGYAPALPTPFAASSPRSVARTVELAEGATRDDVDITLARWGSVAGRVLDENGDPLQGAAAQLLQVKYEAGRRRLIPAGTAPRFTDDLGRFRIYAVAPGRYIVSASVG